MIRYFCQKQTSQQTRKFCVVGPHSNGRALSQTKGTEPVITILWNYACVTLVQFVTIPGMEPCNRFVLTLKDCISKRRPSLFSKTLSFTFGTTDSISMPLRFKAKLDSYIDAVLPIRITALVATGTGNLRWSFAIGLQKLSTCWIHLRAKAAPDGRHSPNEPVSSEVHCLY
jgi:hypothetical protein